MGPTLSPAEQLALTRFRERVTALLGDNLVRIVLFGSRARGAHQALVEARDNLKLGHTSLASLALLRSIGVESKTHGGVQTAIALHFVKPGKLSVGTSRRLKHLKGHGDDRADATSTIAEAQAYVDEADALLAG